MMTLDFLYGIVLLSMIPVRYEPAEQSEMVTQLLFGDTFQVLDKQGAWLHIRNDYDGYEGWISEHCAYQLGEKNYQDILKKGKEVVTSLHATVKENNQAPIFIVKGSRLPNYNSENKSFIVGDRVFFFEGEVQTTKDNVRVQMIEEAKSFLNTPYLWGGKSPYGIDCSGFMQQVANLVRIKLPRDASQQINVGHSVSFLENVEPGDLAFFDNKEGRITHVGMLLGKDRIIHASSKVRIDSIDQEGIYNLELKCYTHHLRAIKNIVD